MTNNNRKSTADCLHFPRDLFNKMMSLSLSLSLSPHTHTHTHTHTQPKYKVQFPFPLSAYIWKECLSKISEKSGRKMRLGGGVYSSVHYKNISSSDRIGSITVGAALSENGGRHEFQMVKFH